MSDDDAKWVAVLRTTDPGFLPIAKSLLDSASIPYIFQGEAGVNLFPLGPAAAWATHRTTGASILVSPERLEEARALLEQPPELDGE
jgi:hypothetical protein